MPGSDGALAVSGNVLERLRTLLRDEGGLIATLIEDAARPDQRAKSQSPASVAAAGPRTRARREEYELLVEAIYEGYLLHYGAPRVVSVAEADVGLLAGDRLYAIGLARLVALGDTAAVAELADTITLSALAQGAGAQALADAVWAAGARGRRCTWTCACACLPPAPTISRPDSGRGGGHRGACAHRLE